MTTNIKNSNNVFKILKNIQDNLKDFTIVKKGFSQEKELIRQQKLKSEKKLRINKNPFEINNNSKEEQNSVVNNTHKFEEKKSNKLKSINISNLREETLLKLESFITNNLKNKGGKYNSNLYEEVRKKFIEFSNQIYLKALKSKEEEEIGLIDLQKYVLDTYLDYFQNSEEIDDNLAKMNHFFIKKFLLNLGINKNTIISEKISPNYLLKLEFLTKKFRKYFEEKNTNNKELNALINGVYLELKFSFIDLSNKITKEAEIHPDKLLELIQLQEKLLYIYKQYFDNDKKIKDNIKKLNGNYSNKFKKPTTNIFKNMNAKKLNTTNIFTNKNAKIYLDKLASIKNNDSFKILESEVFNLYQKHYDIALSILQQINLQEVPYNNMNQQFKNDLKSIFESLEKIHSLYREIFHNYLNRNFKSNDDMLPMINKLKIHQDFIKIKNDILQNKK